MVVVGCPYCGGGGEVSRVDSEAMNGEVRKMGASQSSVARFLGVSQGYIGHLLAGRRPWTMKLAQRLLAPAPTEDPTTRQDSP